MPLKKIAIIPARSGSKGLPNKNILMLVDKPLIAYSIEAALKADIFERVIVSTDSLEYKAIAEQYGAEVILRTQELSSDTASSFMVIHDVLKQTGIAESDYFMLLQPTSPFRSEQHITEACAQYEENLDANFLISMVESDKCSDLIKPIDNDLSLKFFNLDFSNYRRQNLKEYTPNGAIFIGNNLAYLNKKHFFGSDSLAYFMSKVDSVDIDDQLDFELAISIATQNKKKDVLFQSIQKRINEKTPQMNANLPITLIGHSIFDHWNIKKLNGEKVNNLAIAGINSEQYLDFILNKGLIKLIGDKVILLAGTNDIVVDGWQKEDTALWINQMIKVVLSLNPKAKIYLVEVPSVLGRIGRCKLVINDLNTYLKKEFSSKITWIELSHLFNDEFGNLNNNFTYDGLHFTEQAYLALEKEIEKYL